eukprot:1196143-Prorocentrum_minimum.AAC.3
MRRRNVSTLSGVASPVGPVASPLGPVASTLGPVASPLGPVASTLGPVASPLGPVASTLGPVASPPGLLPRHVASTFTSNGLASGVSGIGISRPLNTAASAAGAVRDGPSFFTSWCLDPPDVPAYGVKINSSLAMKSTAARGGRVRGSQQTSRWEWHGRRCISLCATNNCTSSGVSAYEQLTTVHPAVYQPMSN